MTKNILISLKVLFASGCERAKEKSMGNPEKKKVQFICQFWFGEHAGCDCNWSQQSLTEGPDVTFKHSLDVMHQYLFCGKLSGVFLLPRIIWLELQQAKQFTAKINWKLQKIYCHNHASLKKRELLINAVLQCNVDQVWVCAYRHVYEHVCWSCVIKCRFVCLCAHLMGVFMACSTCVGRTNTPEHI